MKKTILIILAATFSLVSQAQIGQGRSMVGGNFNYNQAKRSTFDTTSAQQTTKNMSFNLSVRYGYFFTDHIMAGIFGAYQTSNNTTTYSDRNGSDYSESSNKSTNFSGGIFGRYYQMIGTSRFAIYGQLSLGYGGGTGKSTSTYYYPTLVSSVTNHSKTNFFNAIVNPGIVYFVTKAIAVEASFGNIGFNAQKTDNYNTKNALINEQKTSGINSGLSFSLSSLALGVNFYFGNKTSAPEVPEK